VKYGAGPVIPIVNGSPAVVNFVPPPPDPSNPATELIVDVPSVLANGQAKAVIRAHVVGTDGNALAGVPVTFTISGGTVQGTAVVTVVNGTTDINGDAVIDITNFNFGTVSFTATAKDPVTGTIYPITNGSPATVNFVVGPPVPGDPGGGGSGGGNPGGGGQPPAGGGGSGGSNLKYTVLFVRQDFRLADGKQQDSIIAYVTDGLPTPHPLKNIQIQFFIQNTPTSGTATAGAQFVGNPANVLTDDSGMARIAITSTKPGTVYVDAILIVDGVLIDGSYQIATFLNSPDVNNPLTTLSVVVYEALADGSQQTVVKAHIVDLDGNVMPDQDVTFTIDSGNAVIVTPQPAVTDANGDAYIYITSKTPGYVKITATINGKSIIFGSPAKVKFAPINIYVPKVFTPNNDGTNDLLKPILVGISAFHYFSVYNRWGNLIYTTQDPNQGWDGTFKGVAQPVETYLWIAEGIDVTGKKIVQKGMTSLVR
jgi:gliding motility-associated-like protein